MHITKISLRREMRKHTRPEHGRGFTSIPDGFEHADIEVTADLDAIARELGLRAMGNKSGKTKYLHGLIVVTATNRRRE